MKVIKYFNITVMIISLIFSFFYFAITGILGHYSGSIESFTVPFIVATGLCVFLSIFYSFDKDIYIFLFNLAVFISLFLWAMLAMLQWSGSNDGPGIAWLVFIVFFSFCTSILGVIFLIRTIKILKKEKLKTIN